MRDQPATSPRNVPLCANLGGCDRPAEDGELCRECRYQLRNALAALPGLLADLQVTVTRQSVTSRGGQGKATKAAEEALAFDVDAADFEWAARQTVTAWAWHVAEDRYGALLPIPERVPGVTCAACFHKSCTQIRAQHQHVTDLERLHRGATPPVQFAALCGWLAGHVGWLAGQPEAAQALDELTSLRPFAHRAVDNREDRYAGPCTALITDVRVGLTHGPTCANDCEHESCTVILVGRGGQLTVHSTDRVCGADLRARPGSQLIRCRACGTEHDALERAAWIIHKSDDHLATAADIAAAFADAGFVRSAEQLRKRINTWARRSRQWLTAARTWKPGDPPLVVEAHPIVPVRTDEQGRPLFRIGDIRERLQAGGQG